MRAKRIAHIASSIVAGKSAANSDRTDSLVMIDFPRSPCRSARDVDAVLHQYRLVEAVGLAQHLVPRRVHPALARHGLDRVAGNEPDQEKREQRDPDEGRDDEADPGQDEAEHRVRITPTGAAQQSCRGSTCSMRSAQPGSAGSVRSTPGSTVTSPANAPKSGCRLGFRTRLGQLSASRTTIARDARAGMKPRRVRALRLSRRPAELSVERMEAS